MRLYIYNILFYSQTATTEVQSATIIKGNNHVFISCQFSNGSRAKGCQALIQISNHHSSDSIETQLLSVGRTQHSARAEHCFHFAKSLVADHFEIFDWREEGDIGSIQVPLTVIESMYSPCK